MTRPIEMGAAALAAPATMWREVLGLFKLRIGVVIGVTAIAGWAVSAGPRLAAWQVVVLGLAVMLSSASAGAFNQ
jgi:protoheme IX farnesyltransferase